MLSSKFRLSAGDMRGFFDGKGRIKKTDIPRIVHVLSIKNNLLYSRFGIVFPKKIFKKAVFRNNKKRQIRAILYKHINKIRFGSDIVLVFSEGSKSLSFMELEKVVFRALFKAGVYKR